jgi:hypothetical protein
MLGELLFEEVIDFENQGAYIPSVGAHVSAPCFATGQGRLLRTHEPFRKEYAKAIYLVRHVNDVALSYYSQLRQFKIEIDFRAFLPDFLRGRIDGYGSWSNHVRSWLEADAEVLLVRFEDMKADPERALGRILSFLGATASAKRIRAAVTNNTVSRMRDKEARAIGKVKEFRKIDPQIRFVRKGTVGDSEGWLDGDDLRLVHHYAGETLSRLGYELRAMPLH